MAHAGRRPVAAPRRSRARDAAEWMQSQISTGIWPLNTQIPTEAELVDILGVGRSTVREATQSLVQKGMLEAAAGRGTFVRARSAINTVLEDFLHEQSLPDLLDLRRALEAEAAGLAAARRSDADLARLQRSLDHGSRVSAAGGDEQPSPGSFHADVFAAAANPLLIAMYQTAISVVRHAVALGTLAVAPAERRESEHRALLAAIRDGDSAAARRIAAEHADHDIRRIDTAPPTATTPAPETAEALGEPVTTAVVAPG